MAWQNTDINVLFSVISAEENKYTANMELVFPL